MEPLDHINLDSADVAAIPLDVEEPVLAAIKDRLARGNIHNWLDLYFAGADKISLLYPDMPKNTVHNLVVPLVSVAIEDAI